MIFYRLNFSFPPITKLTSEESNHRKARRDDDPLIEMRDGVGRRAVYELFSSKELRLVKRLEDLTAPKEKRLAIAIGKGSRFDDFLEKVVELGCSQLFFIHFERSVRTEVSQEKRDRIFCQAASQCLPSFLPQVRFLKFRELCQLSLPLAICDPLGPSTLIPEGSLPVVGPEGGLSQGEKELLKDWPQVGLGQNTLRLETAGLCALARQV